MWKIMSANVEANIKQQEIKDLVDASSFFSRSTLKTWNTM